MQQTEKTELSLHSSPELYLSTLTLPIGKAEPDGNEFSSIHELALHLARKCIDCMAEYVRSAAPLAEAKYSAWIWLRASGEIEVVRHANGRAKVKYGEDSSGLLLTSFLSAADVNPTSRYHDWADDPAGPFLIDPQCPSYAFCHTWDLAAALEHANSPRALLKKRTWRRIRLEAFPNDEIEAVIRYSLYPFAAIINDWITLGLYAPALECLTLEALKDAIEKCGPQFIMHIGRRRFFEAMHAKECRALQIANAPTITD